ncbi:hypothetical protein O3M35_004573 [Rhynocoris fuscipes]|uniref:leucine--tRNA ligase n=1 Tax=Rhynocoris fuscipes TaxID=488301 RepID=A0AAW1CLU5_9HEMI
MEVKGRLKVNKLLEIEEFMQKKWLDNHVFEINAPIIEDYEKPPFEKFFTTFPFPYMNGKLHLGHSFSLSKCEFATRYNSLKGKLSLFPFAFHCTGMPIKACADKLKREMDMYGVPPKFPNDSESFDGEIESNNVADSSEFEIKPDAMKSKGKKSKAIAKGSGTTKYQWEIMKTMGFNENEIAKFSDPQSWLEYFPKVAKEDLKRFGIQVDWRRTFITTDANPFFSAFVEWQFRKLYESEKIKYGKRYTIYSSLDGQPCMDHDRSTGEGVGPQEYTIVKLRLVGPYPQAIRDFCNDLKNIYLVAATLRPETMYGQTNVWIHPNIKYICFKTNDGYYICTYRSAFNMAHQGFTKNFGEIGIFIEIMGQELIGSFVTVPMRDNTEICVFPMFTIKDNKGTGIVTSVPSDSPDDYINLMKLKNDTAILEIYNISKNTINKCDVIPVLEIPELGDRAAQFACEKYDVKSPNDSEKLLLAKELVYMKGFYEGIMLVGKCAGLKVKDSKKIVQQELIEKSYAAIYYEPEKPIISRSGDECVVALCDQWFLDYGEPTWKSLAEDCLNHMETFHDEVRKNFTITLDWLHEHACARTYGLGTKLPWDDQWLIESLSDSTIYMAYYTVAHFLENQNSDAGNKIKPEYMTDKVWDYIFDLGPRPVDSLVDLKILEKMRNEFLFWYPVDLRCSGKDLIQNHLTYYLYNHTAIWPKNKRLWPKAVRANGHLLLNSKKMSKSEGNFLTLREALNKYGADGTRIALADAGDSIEDANFSEAVADAAVLRLFNLLVWIEDTLIFKKDFRQNKSYTFQDRVFINEINLKIKETEKFYEKMLFKEALRTGFYEMQNIRDKYKDITSDAGMNFNLLIRWIHVQAILLYPICPHTSEYILSLMTNYNNEKLWPIADEVNHTLLKHSEYLMDACHAFRIQMRNLRQPNKKGREPKLKFDGPLKAIIYVAKTFPSWQALILNELKNIYHKFENQLPDNKTISYHLKDLGNLSKYSKRVMPFVQYIREKFNAIGTAAFNVESDIDEIGVLNENRRYLIDTLKVVEIEIRTTEDPNVSDIIRQETSPYSPYLVIEEASSGIQISLVTPDLTSGYKSKIITLRNGMTVNDIKEFLGSTEDLNLTLWRSIDPKQYTLTPAVFHGDYYSGKIQLSDNSEFFVDETNNTVFLNENQKMCDIGKILFYFIKP